jgi:hypothetical protein
VILLALKYTVKYNIKMNETLKLILEVIAALVGTGLVIKLSLRNTRKKSKKSVNLMQGGVSMRGINNNATIDQSDK